MAVLASASISVNPTFKAKLDILDSQIQTWVEQNYDTSEASNTQWSDFKQTYEGFVASVNSSIQSLNSDLTSEAQERSSYLRFDSDGLWIGAISQIIQLLLKNNKLMFIKNGDKDNPLMYFTDDQGYINMMRILTHLQLGDLTVKVLSDGSIVAR